MTKQMLRLKKTLKKLKVKKELLCHLLVTNNVSLSSEEDFQILKTAKEFLGTNTTLDGELSLPRLHALYSAFIQRFKNGVPKRNQMVLVKDFYRSRAWKSVRFDTLKLHNFRCLACGKGPKEGAVLHVDHIKPLKKYWHLRLVKENLQVLCSDCNVGKGGHDETDLTQ